MDLAEGANSAISATEAEFWQLLLAAELSATKSRAILQSLGSSLSCEGLRRHPFLSPVEKARMESIEDATFRIGVANGILPILPGQYPEILHELVDVPPALFGWGDFDRVRSPMVAIVGTRGASPYGRAAATKFAEALAQAGVTVVSGGALGIDTAAHRGAMSAGGNTVAVLAGGVDKLYPAINRGLFDQIRRAGCLVSQFAIGSKPNSYKFLARNGLIAALSQAVIVIEAPERSGSLRTAHVANELGRQVFVVPATIDMTSFAGSHSLIRDGATLVDHPNQVLNALNIMPVAKKVAAAPASGAGEQILEHLTVQPLSPEKIAERTGLDSATVMSELTMLELEGRAQRVDGGYTKCL